jgi:hypothetical protein
MAFAAFFEIVGARPSLEHRWSTFDNIGRAEFTGEVM